MMLAVGGTHIRVRATKTGEKRYLVRYRLGGRAFKQLSAGTFKTLKEARARRDFVAGEIAAGRDPSIALLALTIEQLPSRTLTEWAELYVAARVDLADETHANVRSHLKRILPTFGNKDPALIRPGDVQAWVAEQMPSLQPASLRRYMATFRLLLDYAGCDPNPAAGVKLPRVEQTEKRVPSASQFAAILSAVPQRWRLPLRVLEQTGMRVGELERLTWGYVDLAGARFLVRRGKTAAARRWVAVPGWLIEELAAAAPLDGGDRRVFPGFSGNVAGHTMRRACDALGLPRFSPHDLRHRYISVKIREGVPAPAVSAQVGHTRKSLTLDVYSHVIWEDE
jgi:integrase